ncbi:hypothetical protein B0H16DRAFT_1693207 [Mycena metata]|uniref:Uncharacterized protein n=1 Tax=Mycena metata TaxID=1033252 RepID=A0AAD7IL81_9AGAR|nr:hypothetical protein B0H16DRAFT_1693207 [Mycena metata]
MYLASVLSNRPTQQSRPNFVDLNSIQFTTFVAAIFVLRLPAEQEKQSYGFPLSLVRGVEPPDLTRSHWAITSSKQAGGCGGARKISGFVNVPRKYPAKRNPPLHTQPAAGVEPRVSLLIFAEAQVAGGGRERAVRLFGGSKGGGSTNSISVQSDVPNGCGESNPDSESLFDLSLNGSTPHPGNYLRPSVRHVLNFMWFAGASPRAGFNFHVFKFISSTSAKKRCIPIHIRILRLEEVDVYAFKYWLTYRDPGLRECTRKNINIDATAGCGESNPTHTVAFQFVAKLQLAIFRREEVDVYTFKY